MNQQEPQTEKPKRKLTQTFVIPIIIIILFILGWAGLSILGYIPNYLKIDFLNQLIPNGKKSSEEIYGPFESPTCKISKHNILCIHFSKQKDFYHIFINNQEYGPYEYDTSIWQSNVKDNYWIYPFKEEQDFYVNVNGNIYGPYASIVEDSIGIYEGGWYFSYMDNDSYYININGEISGPFEYESLYIYDRAGNLIIQYQENGQNYIKLDKKVYGPYELKYQDIDNYEAYYYFMVRGTDIWYIYYQENGKHYLNIQGKIYGPYEEIDRYNIEISQEMIAFKYKEYGKYKFFINGTIYDSEEDLWGFAGDLKISNSNFGFSYLKQGKHYININNDIFGPYKKWDIRGRLMAADFYLLGDHKVISYGKDNKLYLNIDGKKDIECEGILETGFSNNHWGITYAKNYPEYKYYAFIDNKTFGPFEYIIGLHFSENHWGFLFKKDNTWYANIDGKEYGPYPEAVIEYPNMPWRINMFSITDWGWYIKFGSIDETYININKFN
jgi:hypothetical protein